MLRLGIGIALVAFVLQFPCRAARADGAFLKQVLDHRGRVVAVEPRQHTTISMSREVVTLVPFYDGAVSKKQPLIFVNVRYLFSNPGPASTLLIGFPELRSRVKRVDSPSGEPPDQTEQCGTHRHDAVGDYLQVDCPTTIEQFSADVADSSLAVRIVDGKAEYRRWFVFDAAFPEKGELALRNRYVARIGYEETQTNDVASLEYKLEYILHTGSSWTGAIGQGEVSVWDGGLRLLKQFTALRPNKTDDVRALLHLSETASKGRPLFYWNYCNGSQREVVLPHFERASVVQSSSNLPDKELAHLGPMILDRDPKTLWIDNGKQGGVGEWVQIPTHRLGRIRGLVIRSGAVSTGSSHIKKVGLTCFDLRGNERSIYEMERTRIELADRDDDQRILLPRPLGECHALRFTIDELYGPTSNHGVIAEVGLLQ